MGAPDSFVRRLWLGLGILVAATLLGGAAVLVAEQRVGSALARSAEAFSLLEDLKQLRIDLGAAREAEREFLLEDLRTPAFFETGQSAALDRHAAASADLDRSLARLEARGAAADAAVPAMRAAVASYRAGFVQMMSLQRERGWLNAGVIGEMKRASHALQELLGDGRDRTSATLRSELLALVRDQADYLRELDNHKAYLVGERIAILREEIAASAHPRAAELIGEVDAFAVAWERIREIDSRIGIHSGMGLRGALAEAQATVVPLIGAALERARARFEAATATVERAAATARLVSLGAALVAVAIGSFLAVSLGRRLRQSLAAVLAAVEAYARGDRDARVGRLPHRDEFAVLGEAFDRMSETLAEATAELEEINASLELAVKGDTAGLLERVRALVASRKPPS
jgi:hypothetical protein